LGNKKRQVLEGLKTRKTQKEKRMQIFVIFGYGMKKEKNKY